MSAKIHLTEVYMWVRLIHFEIDSALTTRKSSIIGNNSRSQQNCLVKEIINSGKYQCLLTLTSSDLNTWLNRRDEDFPKIL